MERIKNIVMELLVNSKGADGVRFRPLDIADTKEIYNIFSPNEVYDHIHWRPVSLEETETLVKTWLTEKTDVHLMVERGGKPCGIFRVNAYSPESREIWLSLIIIKTGQQNKGLGALVTKQAVDALKKSGLFERMLLGVDADDKAAVKCFQNAGFEIIETTTKKYPNLDRPLERFTMAVNLSNGKKATKKTKRGSDAKEEPR
jgi:ribosomal protein S18 acetylase RimI-like enzyme